MGVFLAVISILELLLGWLPVLGGRLRWALERDIEVKLENSDRIMRDMRGYRYLGPVRMKVTNHSHTLSYRFRLSNSRLLIRRPVVQIPVLRAWRQEFVSQTTTVRVELLRERPEDLSLGPQEDVDLIIEFDRDFPNTGTMIPPHSVASWEVPMVGRIRRLERRIRNLDEVLNQ